MPEPPDPHADPPPASVGEARRGLRTALALVAVAGAIWIAVANLYVYATTRGAIVPAIAAAPERPYAIVLGNRVLPEGVPSLELAQRLDTGRALYAQGRARQIIASGAARAEYDEPHTMARWLVQHGVPPADVILDLGGYRTAATMGDAAAMGVRSALVVSQAYHLPRALYLARRAGIDAVGVAAPPGEKSAFGLVRVHVRELFARAETVLEVALRGVHG